MTAAGYQPVGKDFPVFLHPQTKEEYALARTERKSGRGYTGFAFQASPEVTLEEDLRRRDLTINAMALAPDGTLIDPYGGARDVEAKVLRHVSDAGRSAACCGSRVLRRGLLNSRSRRRRSRCKYLVEDGEVANSSPARDVAGASRGLIERSRRACSRCWGVRCAGGAGARTGSVGRARRLHPEIDTGIHIMRDRLRGKPQGPLATPYAALTHDSAKAQRLQTSARASRA
jgi:tRNA nucleotidyltransferase (CCA-adding enzyme)